MSQRLRIVVTGLIGQYPLGGVTWDYLQYVLGLHNLGHDVYYLEDTGFWPFNPTQGGLSETGCEFNIEYLNQVFSHFGLHERWMFCFTKDSDAREWYGMPEAKRQQVLGSADLLINVSGCLLDPGAYRKIPRMAYIDSDPVFTQVKLALGWTSFREQISTHDCCFTFAENPDHCMPETGIEWIPTRQPIVLDEWRQSNRTAHSQRNALTTIMNWTSYDALCHNNIEYGQKDQEFERFISLPGELKKQNITLDLELAVNQGKTEKTPEQRLKNHGWSLAEPNLVCPDLHSYREYINHSLGEWSVAKQGYVTGQSGWFSCRSACYLAAGRPVIVQDTGFSNVLPCDGGIHAFTSMNEVLQGIEKLQSNYAREQMFATEIASAYFDSAIVLNNLVDQAMTNKSSRNPLSLADYSTTPGDAAGSVA